MSDEEKTGGVVKATEFKSAGDWINQILDDNCATIEGAVEAKDAVLDDDGKEIEAAVRGKKGKRVVDKDALCKLADENNITYKEYPNVGMYRMNIGNMLRAAAKKRHGLYINGAWVEAPDDFPVNENITEDKDGSKIAVKVEAAE